MKNNINVSYSEVSISQWFLPRIPRVWNHAVKSLFWNGIREMQLLYIPEFLSDASCIANVSFARDSWCTQVCATCSTCLFYFNFFYFNWFGLASLSIEPFQLAQRFFNSDYKWWRWVEMTSKHLEQFVTMSSFSSEINLFKLCNIMQWMIYCSFTLCNRRTVLLDCIDFWGAFKIL